MPTPQTQEIENNNLHRSNQVTNDRVRQSLIIRWRILTYCHGGFRIPLAEPLGVWTGDIEDTLINNLIVNNSLGWEGACYNKYVE